MSAFISTILKVDRYSIFVEKFLYYSNFNQFLKVTVLALIKPMKQ